MIEPPADRSEQPRALDRPMPEDPESPTDAVATFAVKLGSDVHVDAAIQVLRSLPGVLDVAYDEGEPSLGEGAVGRIVVRGRRDMLSDDELLAAVEGATPDTPG